MISKINNCFKFKKENALSGFTLIELLVTFSLLSVLSGIGFISFASYGKRQVVQQVAEDIKQSINLARFNAVSSIKPASCGVDTLSSYTFKFCVNGNCNLIDGTLDGHGYALVVNCGAQHIPITIKKLATEAVLAQPSSGIWCQDIMFTSGIPTITGGPCVMDIGTADVVHLSIDSNGYAKF